MNIIDERDVRTINRKLKKKEYDEIITLSASDKDEVVRLLDEGAVVTADGYIDFYIMKGTLQKYYDSLPDDYEGSINLGHMPFANFPILLGKWTKKDLSLVDTGSGRMGLDVKLRLDEENFLVKELRRADYTLGVSVEMGFSRNEERTEDYGILMVDDVFIHDFAIVGDAGNVNSSGIRLKTKGENMDFQKILALLGDDADLEKVNDILDKLSEAKMSADDGEKEPEEGEKDLEAEENEPEEGESTPEEDEKDLESGEGDTDDGEKGPEPETEESPEGEAVELSAVMALVQGLTERVEALESEKTALETELNAKKQAEADFVKKFKKLSVSLSTERKEPEVVHNEVSYTDGFGG